MKFLDRLGLSLFSILTLTLSIVTLLMGFGVINPSVFSVLMEKVLVTQNGTYILIGVSIVLILLAIRCLFFSPDYSKKAGSDSGILMQNNDGRLLITKSTIEDIVAGVINNMKKINSASTNVVIDNDNNVLINVSLELVEGAIIKDVSSELQTRIKKSIKEATDLDLKAVNIEVKNLANSLTEDTNEEVENKKVSKSKKR